jgi:hypothetical protein
VTQQTPVFDISEFELRSYTNPYLTPTQATEVADIEGRVNDQLDFLAQMLGWNGSNYWDNLPSTVDQKRQLLGGTFGVYNSYVIPKVYEIRNWSNEIVVDRIQFLTPGRRTQVARVLLGDNVYQLQSLEVEGDKYVVSIGELDQEFFDLIAANEPLRIDIPTYRPAPFRRDSVGVSGDATFVCGNSGSDLVLYPAYDTQKQFPVKFPILFAGSVYYFNQPIYLALTDTLSPDIAPEYDADLGLWYFQVPQKIENSAGITAYLAWANSNVTQTDNYSLQVIIQPWVDPSDWGSINTLDNFQGVWGNKGGVLPFNFMFDALSIHGFSERDSIYLPNVTTSLNFDDIVNYIYYQKTTISTFAPGNPQAGDLWWNDATGALAVWLPGESGCGNWVEVDYRQQLRQIPPAQVIYPDVATFRANSGTLAVGTVVRIDDITGLAISDNVLGVQGTLSAAGWLVLHRDSDEPYWTPDEFGYADVPAFERDAKQLPYKVPVTIFNALDLSPSTYGYTVRNLGIRINGDYEVILVKYYNNTTWEIYPDSLLKYIAFSTLFATPVEGEMEWDFSNPDPNTREASIYYGANGWIGVNKHAPLGPRSSVFNLKTVRFYCEDNILEPNVAYETEDFSFTCTQSTATGEFKFSYAPRTFAGKARLPKITISDSLTTTYRADITDLVFSGITYYLSPNVYNAETPLRLWKAEALQVAETVDHLEENNYINPLVADLNDGPGPENWEKYFVRLPLEYGRDEAVWQKVALICQDFGYWGSSIEPEQMRCPPEDDTPVIFEELFLYDQPIPDYTYVYTEPYLYSNVAYFNSVEESQFQNSGVYPATDVEFDEFFEAELVEYDPLHNRRVYVKKSEIDAEIARILSEVEKHSAVNPSVLTELADYRQRWEGKVYGDWQGDYVNVNPCVPLTGFVTTDLLNGAIEPVAPPVWDASIYKFAPTCEFSKESYAVDANHYKVGYAYFVADASAAEDAFFDISKEASWRYPVEQPKTLYLTPR